MKQFDYYEFTAILVPGAAFLISLGVLFPDVFGERYLQTISVGDFGIFVVAAYVFGHIIQSFGNIYERIVWKFFKGQPTDWILAQNNRLFTAEQTKQLHDKIHKIMNVKLDGQSRIMMPLTRQIYTILKRENKTGRIDIFNANYGLNRALAAALCASTLLSLFLLPDYWPLTVLLIVVAALLTYRMYDFGVCYARELYLEFLVNDDKGGK